MNRYHLVHTTEFSYERPVSESYNELRLRPLEDDRQSCVSFRLTTTPMSRGTSYRDSLGNWVHQFNIIPEHRRLKIEAEAVVLTHEMVSPPAEKMSLAEFEAHKDQLHEDHFDFLAPSEYVPRLPQLAEYTEAARQASDGTIGGFAQAASDMIHDRFRYVKGATHVHSSVEDALALGAGVCQDFAHLMLGIVRTQGLPGRYVSGYLVPGGQNGAKPKLEEVIGGQASHAWVEVYLPNVGWTSFDPTLGQPVELRHVRIAYGRDYGDVPPVRGVFKGHSGQQLFVDVRVRPEVDDAGHEMVVRAPEVIAEPAAESERSQQPYQQQQSQQSQQQQQ